MFPLVLLSVRISLLCAKKMWTGGLADVNIEGERGRNKKNWRLAELDTIRGGETRNTIKACEQT